MNKEELARELVEYFNIKSWEAPDIVEYLSKTYALIPLRDMSQKINPQEVIKLNYNCTLLKMAEQIGIELWQAMEMGRYFKNKYRIEDEKGEEK